MYYLRLSLPAVLKQETHDLFRNTSVKLGKKNILKSSYKAFNVRA